MDLLDRELETGFTLTAATHVKQHPCWHMGLGAEVMLREHEKDTLDAFVGSCYRSEHLRVSTVCSLRRGVEASIAWCGRFSAIVSSSKRQMQLTWTGPHGRWSVGGTVSLEGTVEANFAGKI